MPFSTAFHQGIDAIILIAIVTVFLERVGARLQLGQIALGTAIGFASSMGIAAVVIALRASVPLVSLDGVLFVIHFLAGGALLMLCGWMCEQRRIVRTRDFAAATYARAYVVILVIILAILHQGIELAIHVYDFVDTSSLLGAASLGGYLAAMLVGVCTYYALRAVPLLWLVTGSTAFVGVLAAGMWATAMHYAATAGIISSLTPIWDTTAFVADTSLLGYILQAFFGYVARPTAAILGGYLLAWGVLAVYAYRVRCARG